ncbi:MAG: hypothetical protein SVS85_00430 [Candidatus Nanohaloarchaea archaeon]|nr:hypothetical protein [Candidatus Nanohaloarchaea archaeon]
MADVVEYTISEIKSEWSTVRDRSSIEELLILFLLIPLTLVLVEIAIQSNLGFFQTVTRGELRFNITSPDVMTAFLSTYAHDGIAHLRHNIVSYGLIMSALYPLAIRIKRRDLLWISLGIHLLITPFLIAWANVQVPLYETAIGFSGVGAALSGLLLILVFIAATGNVERAVNPIWAVAPASLIMAFILAILPMRVSYLNPLPESTAIVAMLGFVFAIAFVIRHGLKTVFSLLDSVLSVGNIIEAWGLIIAVSAPLGLFVQVSPQDNVVGHLAGYYLGLAVAVAYCNYGNIHRLPETITDTIQSG